MDGDLKRSDSYGRRFPTQVLSARAAAFRAEVTGGGYSLRGYDTRTGPVAEYEGAQVHSRSAVEATDHWRGDSDYNKRIRDFQNADFQNLKQGGDVDESRFRERGSAVQPNRVMSPEDVAGPLCSTLRRPRASSAAASALSPLHHENRFRTLGDRAYHHPDVPRTPLFSEHNCDPSSWNSGDVVPKTCGTSTSRDSDIDNRFVSSPETERTFPSPRSDNSQNSSSPAQPRLRAPLVSRGDGLHSSHESCAPTHARRPELSSPALPQGHSLHIDLPSGSSLGIGLSTIDNGAFEAPRAAPAPAPAPRFRAKEKSHPPVAWQRNYSLRIRTGSTVEEGNEKGSPASRRPLRSLSLTRKRSNTTLPADPRVARSATPVVSFGAISFRWQIWSKSQRPSETSDTPQVGRLHAARKSEPDVKTSFIETEAKPQKKRLWFRKKT